MLQILLDIYLSHPVAQTIWIIAAVILTASGTIKDDKKMLYILTASFAFWSIHFYLLGFYTAAFLYLFMLVRNFFLFRYPKNKPIFIISAIIPIVSLLFTYNGYIDLVATMAPLVFVYSVYALKWFQLRVWMIIISLIWLWYSWVASSIGWVATEIIYLWGIAIGIARMYFEKK